jgi:hypothetical protein
MLSILHSIPCKSNSVYSQSHCAACCLANRYVRTQIRKISHMHVIIELKGKQGIESRLKHLHSWSHCYCSSILEACQLSWHNLRALSSSCRLELQQHKFFWSINFMRSTTAYFKHQHTVLKLIIFEIVCNKWLYLVYSYLQYNSCSIGWAFSLLIEILLRKNVLYRTSNSWIPEVLLVWKIDSENDLVHAIGNWQSLPEVLHVWKIDSENDLVHAIGYW